MAYLDNHEKHCSQISVSTFQLNGHMYVHRMVMLLCCDITLSSSVNFLASQLALHHSSVCPDMCILSTTICISARRLVDSVRFFSDRILCVLSQMATFIIANKSCIKLCKFVKYTDLLSLPRLLENAGFFLKVHANAHKLVILTHC